MDNPNDFHGSDAVSGDLLIYNAKLIDGTGGPIRDGLSILIRDGVIEQIGKEIHSDDIPMLNAEGAYVLPGLIDSHVHLMWGPGALIQNREAPDQKNWLGGWGKNYRNYLKAYLACGVTTIMDAVAPPFVTHEIRDYLSGNNPGPRYLSLGPFIAPQNGYGDMMEFTVSEPGDVKKRMDVLQSMGTRGVKLSLEKGWNKMGLKYAMHTPDVLQAVKEESDKRDLPVYVHATCEEDQTTALKLGVHALAHTLIGRKEKLSDKFIELMKQTNSYQMTTLTTMDAELTYFHTGRLNDPLLELTVPEEELAAARDLQKRQLSMVMGINYALARPPKVAGGLVKFMQRFPRFSVALFMLSMKLFYSKRIQERSIENSKDAINRLYKAGVPIVMGSDTTYTPSALFAFHGSTSLREIELLGEAGLPAHEAIRAATSTPSKMLGLDHEIGTVEVGKRGDLAIVRENPLENLRALRTIQWTVKDGISKTPVQWMNS